MTTIPTDSPSSIAVNPNTNKTYVTNYYDNSVSVINSSSNKLLYGVTFSINPLASGNIICDQRKISGTDYRMYDNNTELTCHAILNPGYEFSLWSSDLTPSNSSNSADISFKVSHYGYLTANFRQASTVTIPTDLLYGVILGPTVGSITAWFIPFFGIVGEKVKTCKM